MKSSVAKPMLSAGRTPSPRETAFTRSVSFDLKASRV